MARYLAADGREDAAASISRGSADPAVATPALEGFPFCRERRLVYPMSVGSSELQKHLKFRLAMLRSRPVSDTLGDNM